MEEKQKKLKMKAEEQKFRTKNICTEMSLTPWKLFPWNNHKLKNPCSSLPGHKRTTDFLDFSYLRHTSKKFQFLYRIMQAACANYREPVDNAVTCSMETQELKN